jgi:Ca-activated chloride channel homolog
MRLKVIVLIILTAAVAVYGDEYRSLMNQGEKQYRKQDFTASADKYKEAEVVRPDDPIATFNNGAALYKGNDLEKAKERFAQAAAKSKDQLKAESYYDLGNTLYKGQDYANALGAYKEALTIDPKNDAAKFNFELTKKKLEQQQQQQQKQDQQNKDNKDKQNQDQKNQQDQQNKQDQDKNKQDKDKNKQDQNQDKQQQQNQQNQQQQKDQQDKQQQNQPAKPGEMNKQEAKQLLSAFKEDEKQVQEQLRKFKVRSGSSRDW